MVALTGGRNIARLARDARDLGPTWLLPRMTTALTALAQRFGGHGHRGRRGRSGLVDAATRPADWIMSAIVGAAGLPPGLKALEQGTTLALANKESLVTAGPLLMETARRHGATDPAS